MSHRLIIMSVDPQPTANVSRACNLTALLQTATLLLARIIALVLS